MMNMQQNPMRKPCADFMAACKQQQIADAAIRRRLRCVFMCALCITGGRVAFADDPIPVLPIGIATNLNLVAGEIAEFFLPDTDGTTYTLDLASTGHASVLVTDPKGQSVGRFLAAYGMTFTVGEESVYTLSISGNGQDPLDARLTAYDVDLPFYRQAAEEERPEFMTNPWHEGAEFGYVYVPADRSPENRYSYRLAVIQMPGGPDATAAHHE